MPRPSFAAVLPVLLAACGSPAAENASAPISIPTPAPSPSPTPLTEVTPLPGELKTFRDWTVGCDNVGDCKAVALAPEDAVREWPVFMMSVKRDAGARGAIRVTFSGQEDAVPPITVIVDGRTVARGGDASGFAGEAAAKLIAASTDADTVTIDAGGKRATHSLAGLAAALRYMDAEQDRAGTTGALVAKGDRPDTSVAKPGSLVRAITPGGSAAKLTDAAAAHLRKGADCSIAEFRDTLPDPETHALGGGRTLVLLPCEMGAYNLIAALYVIGPDGKPVSARIDAPSGIMGEDHKGVPTVVNGAFENGVLDTFAKGRGLGDCGVNQRFAWDGKQFRLIEQREMGECRGSIDYIRTWQARVERADG
jgi:hypothetical protein